MIVRILALLLIPLLLVGCGNNKRPLDPNDPIENKAKLRYEIGIDALYKGQLPKAFAELMEADRLTPNRPEILDAIGYAWRLHGNTAKAEESYRKAMANSPSPATHNNYGSLLLQMKRPVDAEAQFRLALEDPRYPNQDMAYINLGDALLMQNRADDAIAAYRQARLLNPDQDISLLHEAQAYQKSDRPHYARALYETLLRKVPNSRPVLEGLIPLLRQQGEVVKARQLLTDYLEQASDPLEQAWAKDELYRLKR